MKYTINKGDHRALLSFGLWFNKTIIRKEVVFYPSAKYILNTDDQYDINKLFGIGYLFNHHKESARFGWRYNNASGMFEIFAYCYVNGQRIDKQICGLQVNKTYVLSIEVYPDYYKFSVNSEKELWPVRIYSIPKWHKKKWSFPLSLYFGGNRTAPHNITIEMRNV